MDAPQLQPPPISDEEVEQLLQQAESLVDQIADEPGAEFGKPPPLAEEIVAGPIVDQYSTIVPPAADPLQAIANTEAIAEELTAILDEASEASAAQTPAPETPHSDPVSDRTVESTPAAPEVVPRAVPARRDEIASGRPPHPAPPDSHEDAPIEPTPRATGPAPPVEHRPPSDASHPERNPATRTPLKTRLAALTRGALLVLTAVPVALVNLVLRLMVLLDRPFARFSAKTKLCIGLAGLVTLFMGAAAWLLPRIAVQNPYAAMGP